MRRFEIFTDWFDIENGTTVDPEIFLRMGGGGSNRYLSLQGWGFQDIFFTPFKSVHGVKIKNVSAIYNPINTNPQK